MRKSMKTILAALVLATPLALTSCEGTLDDVFGEWSRPSGNTNTDPTPAVSNNYMEWDGTALAAKAIPTTGIQEVTDATTSFEGGFYIVKTDVTIPAPGILINADTKLILCDGATLTVNGYFEDQSSTATYSLTIYGQENQTGKLTVNAPDGYPGTTVKDLEIHGGDINIKGATGLYAINTTGNISIYGGKVTATGGDADGTMTGGPGIFSSGGNIIIAGNAQVNAYGGAESSTENGGDGILLSLGNLTISGTPTIVATSGAQMSAIDVAYTFVMTGGDVTATAGADSKGICVQNDDGATISFDVSGGTITAIAGNATTGAGKAGIDVTGTSNITGGTVNTTGGKTTSGTGGTGFSSTTIALDGGTLTATGGDGSTFGGSGIEANLNVNNCILITATGGAGATVGLGVSQTKSVYLFGTALKYYENGTGSPSTDAGATQKTSTNNPIACNARYVEIK